MLLNSQLLLWNFYMPPILFYCRAVQDSNPSPASSYFSPNKHFLHQTFFSFFNQLPEREKNAVKETHFFTKRSLTTLNIFNALVDTIVSKILKWTKVFFPFFIGGGGSAVASKECLSIESRREAVKQPTTNSSIRWQTCVGVEPMPASRRAIRHSFTFSRSLTYVQALTHAHTRTIIISTEKRRTYTLHFSNTPSQSHMCPCTHTHTQTDTRKWIVPLFWYWRESCYWSNFFFWCNVEICRAASAAAAK